VSLFWDTVYISSYAQSMLLHYLWNVQVQICEKYKRDVWWNAVYLVMWFDRQRYSQMCNSCLAAWNVHLLPTDMLKDAFATRQLHQWRSGPCRAKRPTNASSVRQFCAAATDALAAGCHPISCNRLHQDRCYLAATNLEEW